MRVSVDLGRWTALKAALLVGVGIGVAGAVGSAVAISPTIEPPIRWGGGVEFIHLTGESALAKLYSVPAGRNFLLTDLVVTNLEGTAATFSIHSELNGICQNGPSLAQRSMPIVVPAQNNTVLAFQTGIGVGQALCVRTNAELAFTGRGFLFTLAPAN